MKANALLTRFKGDAEAALDFCTKGAKYEQINCDPDTYVALGESSYPIFLKEIPDAPLVLFFKGAIQSIDWAKSLSIVGTRKMSAEGARAAAEFAQAAAGSNITTVSGLAFGIDSVVHEETIKSGGKTVAVIGSQIGSCTPKSNQYLYDRIIDAGGAVVSEFFRLQKYDKWIYPRRNRIIAGLTMKTLVVEAPAKSGSMITAELALDYNREVFSVPGSIFHSGYEFSNYLIKSQRAQLVTSFNDIFSGIQNENPAIVFSEAEEALIKNIKNQKGKEQALEVDPLQLQLLQMKLDIAKR